MPQPYMPVRTVWAELWEAHPILYSTLTLTSTINTTLLSLLLIAFLSTAHDTLRIWAGSRRLTRQTHTYTLLNSSSGALEIAPIPYAPYVPYGPLSHLAHSRNHDLITVYTKAIFRLSLYLGLQHVASAAITRVARILASTFTSALDGNARRQCERLLERGLDCDAALRFHAPLLVLVAGGVLCVIRGLGVHVDVGVPCRVRQAQRRRDGDGGYSPGFLRLVAGARGVLQSVLAVPSTVVRMYGTIPRDEYEWPKRGRLFVTQVMVSGLVFVMENVVCVVAVLPDFQGTMGKLHGSGITGKNKGV